MDWTDKNLSLLRKWRCAGMTYQAIADKFGNGCTRRLVSHLCTQYNIKAPLRNVAGPVGNFRDDVIDIADLKARCALHLEELLAAGHDPAVTEYKITPERSSLISRPSFTSGCGSSAALCVDAAGRQ